MASNPGSYAKWVDDIFRSRGDAEDDGEEASLPDEEFLQFATALFETSGDLPSRYSSEELENGFWRLLGAPSPLADLLWDESVEWSLRDRCIRAMPRVFEDLFAENPLNQTCFMWWDLLRTFESTRPERVEAAMAQALRAILGTASRENWRSALHGLGHLVHQDRAAIIDEFVAQHPDLDDQLKEYAAEAKAGAVL